MDQFRGYTVAGMFVVNFLGHMAAIHAVMKHHNTYFSYADSIMPSFVLAAGFSYRLTAIRRLATEGRFRTYLGYFRRSLALILVSLMLNGLNTDFSSWDKLTSTGTYEVIARLLKANLWEILAIIGVTQIFIMPVIGARSWVRFSAMILCAAAHVWLSHSFNFNWVYKEPCWMDQYWGATKAGPWDGGFFGVLSWSAVMLAGTLAYDIVVGTSRAKAAARFLCYGAVLLVLGYGMSCLTRLYDVEPGQTPTDRKTAESPVLPPLDKIHGRSWSSLLAEPPFVQPPPENQRKLNYWMMGKKVVSLSFITFATGYAFALYGLFVIISDLGGWKIGVFRTFGQNPLAAYVIHGVVEHAVTPMVPEDSPFAWCMVGFAVFFGVTYIAVRFLEKHKIYIRL